MTLSYIGYLVRIDFVFLIILDANLNFKLSIVVEMRPL